ncbi:hypothetical protein NQZ68_038641, partial [Dissostichus eleginoides]
QISPESSRQSNGERKRMRRGKCMQILGARWISAAAALRVHEPAQVDIHHTDRDLTTVNE